MSNSLRIKFVGGKMVVVGEVANTTKTLMTIHNAMKKNGIEYELEEKGFALMPTTFCG